MPAYSSLAKFFARALAAALLVVSLPLPGAEAVEFPDPGSPLYFQTSGPEAGLNIGDWYTSSTAGNTDHVILLPVPDAWPATQAVTVAVYDPESYSGGSTGLSTNDEVRDAGDTTRFTLVDPGAGTLAQGTFSSTSATHGAWIEILTFLPTPGTVYELHSETGVGAAVSGDENDDNSWRLLFANDPDCTVGQPVGTCTGIDDGDEVDDADGTPGTGDELAMGFKRASYQYSPGSTVTFWFYVDATVDATVTLHNFDLDNNGSATYYRADGSSVTGTVSGGTRWNGSTNATRVGDVVSTSGSTGWWRAAIGASGNNQFSFEVDGQVPVYFTQPPTPILDISIDDSDLDITEGESHHYVITVDNTSDATSAPGAAFDSTVTVPLPAGVVYVDCSAPVGISCSESGGLVTYTFSDPIAAGDLVTLGLDVDGGAGLAATVPMQADVVYEDQLGNSGPPDSDTDTDTTLYPDLTISIGPDASAAPADIAVLDVAIGNIGGHIQPGTTASVPIPAGVTVDGAGTDPRWSCGDGDAAPTVCIWSVGTMSPGDSDTAPLAFALPATIGAGAEQFSATATIAGTYYEPVLGNNEDSATVTIDAAPDLAVDVLLPPAYVPGSQTDWSVQVDNLGDQDSTGVAVEVTVPADANADAAIVEGWTCVPDTDAGSTCTYDVGPLTSGGSVLLPFPVDTDPAAIGDATLPAYVHDDGLSGPETDLTNNDDDETVAADPTAELTIDVVATVDPVNVGDGTEFTITVGNTGPSRATDVVLTVDVPADLGGATPPAGCSVTGILEWTCAVGDLDPGSSVDFVAAGSAIDESITLTAQAASPEDPDGAQDLATVEANRPPVASDTSAETQDEDPVSVLLPASDPDGDPLTATASVPDGTVTVVYGPDGPEVLYTPGLTTAGVVVIDYEVCDPDGLCDQATIEVLVKRAYLTATSVCIADVPYLSYETILVGVDGSPTATVTWTDGVNTFTISDLPLSGLALWPGAAIDDLSADPMDRQATDWPGWYLDDGIWIAGDDGFLWARSPLTVTVTVNPTSDPISATYPPATAECAADADGPANQPPTGVDLSGWATETMPYVVDLLELTSDPDGDVVSLVSVTPTSGMVTLDGSTFTYTPSPGESGMAVFDVTITDGRGATATFTVTVLTAPLRTLTGEVWVDEDSDGANDDDRPLDDVMISVTHAGPDGVLGTDDDLGFGTVSATDGTWKIPDVPVGLVLVEATEPGGEVESLETEADHAPIPFDESLPATGWDFTSTVSFGLTLILAGSVILLAARREEAQPSHS